MHTETRVSNTTTPGCRTARDPGVIQVFLATKLSLYYRKTKEFFYICASLHYTKEKHRTMIKILLLIDYSSEFDRKLLRGLVQYSKENGPWLFYRLPSYYSAMHGEQGILKWAKEWKADAIIGQWNNDTIDLQKELNIPVVLQNYHHRSVTYSNLTGDYKGTGRMAAQFFAKRMFRNFAYFGVKGVVWSDERCEGYRQEVKRIGGEFFSFESDKQEDEIRMEVSQWLQQLPKPVALFCCDDAHALFISETCKMTNIPIPEEIALLGVDNDELMCNISDPPISSIELEVERGGYSIGRLIHQQIKNGTRRYFQYCYQSYPHRITAIYGETQYQRPLYSGSSEVYRVSLRFRFDHRVSACKHSAIPQKLRSEIQKSH